MIPECCLCNRIASLAVYTTRQSYCATLTIDGIPDAYHRTPIGDETRVCDITYYCEECYQDDMNL